ncbi:MAG TPA: hypothetical protein VF544_00645 [Pyrinomonadaceae bacterium]|jgi:hypothetical protein
MKYRLCLALILMAFWLPVTCPADEAGDAENSAGTAQGSEAKQESAARLRPGMPVAVTLTDLAFADARGILSEDNSCSAFFGGASKAVTVLDALAERINLKGLPDRRLGISMTGGDGLFVSQRTGYQYRLFKQVIINTNGPFYRSGVGPVPPPPCGSFGPNTREARVLMLLHELGHLIKRADGKWLLPDDGGNYQRSLSNTRVVESKCLSQIKGLTDVYGGEK